MITTWFMGNKLKTFGAGKQQSFAFYVAELPNTPSKGISLKIDALF